MNKEEKNKMIDSLSIMLKENPHFYLTDTSGLTVEKINKLRRLCFQKNIKMLVVKNTLLRKAMQKTNVAYNPLHDTLKGNTTILFSTVASDPAKVIKAFRSEGNEKPMLKSAFVEESIYIGHNHLEALASIKSKNEMIGEIIASLQSQAKNVLSGLLSGKNKIAGILRTLETKTK
jgi:large subunit ribosomal protein L10